MIEHLMLKYLTKLSKHSKSHVDEGGKKNYFSD